jgi:hypothetical protein
MVGDAVRPLMFVVLCLGTIEGQSSSPSPAPTALDHPEEAWPTSVPSPECGSDKSLYHMHLYDDGGDGWQGVSFQIRNSTSNAQHYEGAVLDSGTLHDGFSGTHWVCLQDGCYEIYTHCHGTCTDQLQSEVSWT